MIMRIRHIWFDFTDTIASIDRSVLDGLIYTLYAEAKKQGITPALIEEYKAELKARKSNSAVFAALGFPAGYLSDRINDRSGMYTLTDRHIPEVLQKLSALLPVSVFSNSRLTTVLPQLDIKLEWFTHILGPDVVKNPKPAPDGFLKMVELSGIASRELLFIGDDVEKDLVPAKALGITTGLLWQKSDEADYCFEDFKDVLSRFE